MIESLAISVKKQKNTVSHTAIDLKSVASTHCALVSPSYRFRYKHGASLSNLSQERSQIISSLP